MKNKSDAILSLAEEILKNIELEEIGISSVVMKCSRLARLDSNSTLMRAFQYELAGYPWDENGFIPPKAWIIGEALNRIYTDKDEEGKFKQLMFTETISELEASLEANKKKLETSTVPIERMALPRAISIIAGKIGKLKAAYYSYALGVYYKLKFAAITEEIFNRMRKKVDEKLQRICPDALKKFINAYENLKTGEDEDWANAVHSCRRILKDVADSLYPLSDQEVTTRSGDKVKLDEEHYVLRLIEYVKSQSKSETFTNVVGSTLDHIGSRIDSVYKSSTKGTHTKVEKEEAERYVIHTYLLIGDVLSLEGEEEISKAEKTPAKRIKSIEPEITLVKPKKKKDD